MATFPLNGLRLIESTHPVPKATDAALRDAESGLFCSLPTSYREWCKVYGAGELARFFRIAAPMEVSHTFNLIEYNRAMREGEGGELWQDRIGADLFERAVFFAETIGGEFYFWDQQIQSSGASAEFPIYYSPRHVSPEKCSDAFEEWILKTCLSPNDDEEGRSRWQFRQFSTE